MKIIPMKSGAPHRGFSLIELMITVAIVGILAAIAFPSYRQYVVRGNRADAQAELLATSQGMERFFVANNTYLGAATAGADTGAPTVGHTQSPETGTAIYNLTISAAFQTTYALRATPVGAQATDGFLSIDNTGARAWDKNNNGMIDSGENTWNK